MTSGGSHELIEHTGDIGFRVQAPALESLYDAATEALFDVILDVESVAAREPVDVAVSGASDPPDLLVRFLSELLFLHDARDWLFRRFETDSVSAQSIAGRAYGERFDPKRHVILRQVKAVTYHHLRLAQTAAGYEARVVLDL